MESPALSKIKAYLENLIEQVDADLPNHSILCSSYSTETLISKPRRKIILFDRNSKWKDIKPKWRHYSEGRRDPALDKILKGKALWKAIVQALICLIIRPSTTCNKAKATTRDRECLELTRTITVFFDICGQWIYQQIKAPMRSICEDETLDFLITHRMRSKTRAKKGIQLKVRLYSVLKSLTNSGNPPLHIQELLSSLVIDGNYFPAEFLFDHEKNAMEFDALGGSKNMISFTNSIATSTMNARNLSAVNVGRDTSKVRMLVINFILVRSLILHIALTPSHFTGCVPDPEVLQRATMNHRILASAIYQIVSRLEHSQLPPLAGECNGTKYISGSRLEIDLEAALEQAVSQGDGTHANNVAQESSEIDNMNDKEVLKNGGIIRLKPQSQSSADRTFNWFPLMYEWCRVREFERNERLRILHKEVTAYLSHPSEGHNTFCSMPMVLKLLCNAAQMEPYKTDIDLWTLELLPGVNNWIDLISDNVVQILVNSPRTPRQDHIPTIPGSSHSATPRKLHSQQSVGNITRHSSQSRRVTVQPTQVMPFNPNDL